MSNGAAARRPLTLPKRPSNGGADREDDAPEPGSPSAAQVQS